MLIQSFVTMMVKNQLVLLGIFALKFFLAVDQCQIFIKNKFNYFLVVLFGTWSHIFVPPGTLVSVLSDTFYLDHHTILSDG